MLAEVEGGKKENREEGREGESKGEEILKGIENRSVNEGGEKGEDEEE